MKLPIPIFAKSGKVYTDIDIVKPKASVIADTRKTIDSNRFMATKIFVSGCIESIYNDDDIVSDKIGIRGLVALMPYRSVEYVSTQIMLLYDPDNDYVEGIYSCPRCGHQVISELINNDDMEIDTRDLISNLGCEFMEDPLNEFTVVLNESVSLINKATKEVIETIESLTLRHPTLSDCIAASQRYSISDSVRLQFATYVEALTKINGNEIDKKYRFNFGMTIFENIKDVKNDMGQLNIEVSRYGMNPMIKKVCNSCGKEFETYINMSNFFVSGLIT